MQHFQNVFETLHETSMGLNVMIFRRFRPLVTTVG